LKETDSYREWPPSSAWRRVVSCCWEHRVAAGGVRRILPDGCADLLMFESGACEVVGLYDEVATPEFTPGTRLCGIRFRPEAVGAAFGVDAAALRNQTVALTDVVGARRAQQIADERRIDTWIRSIELDRRAVAAVRLLAGELRVEDVSARIGISERQLRRIVLAETGVGPKVFQRIARLRRLLTSAEGGDSLAMAAATAGYSDQAHMTREVVRLSGLTPVALLAERRRAVAAA
jgi:AraC-like DNA-binding protein